ncbi:hypothetical protein AMTRI_Chr01g130290 [Amborella trichopoda]
MMPLSVNYLLLCCTLFGSIREWIHDLAIAWALAREDFRVFRHPNFVSDWYLVVDVNFITIGTWWLTWNLKTIFGGLSNMAPQSFNVIDKLYGLVFAKSNQNN